MLAQYPTFDIQIITQHSPPYVLCVCVALGWPHKLSTLGARTFARDIEYRTLGALVGVCIFCVCVRFL